jgi:hypothetical protein
VNDTIVLTIPTSPGHLGIATLVLGGIGSRLHMPYEKVDDLQLAVLSALAATDGETVSLEISAGEELVVGIGPLADGSGADAGLRRVLDRLLDSVESTERDGREWLTLRLARSGVSAA